MAAWYVYRLFRRCGSVRSLAPYRHSQKRNSWHECSTHVSVVNRDIYSFRTCHRESFAIYASIQHPCYVSIPVTTVSVSGAHRPEPNKHRPVVLISVHTHTFCVCSPQAEAHMDTTDLTLAAIQSSTHIMCEQPRVYPLIYTCFQYSWNV